MVNTPKKILVLNYEFPPIGGGASPVSYDLSKAYVIAGFNVTVVTSAFKELPKKECRDGINIVRVPSLRKNRGKSTPIEQLVYVVSATVWGILNWRFVKNCDVCHCHFLIPTGIVAVLFKKVFRLNYFTTVHGGDINGYINKKGFTLLYRISTPIARWVAKNSIRVVTPSRFIGELAVKQGIVPKEKVEYIPNGIDSNSFPVHPIGTKKRTILAVGRIVREKGFQYVLKATHYISASGWEVHIAGEGEYMKELENISKSSKIPVIFHGWVEKGSCELLNLFREASIFILPSKSENASIALLEGMLSKCAIITTAGSGSEETVSTSGFITKFGDVEQIKEILQKLVNDPQLLEEYQEKAYQRVQAEFLFKNVAKKYCKLAHKLISEIK